MKAMMSMDMAQMLVSAENKQRKMQILVSAIAAGVVCLVFMGLYFARFDSVARYQADLEDEYPDALWRVTNYQGGDVSTIYKKDVVAYDLECLFANPADPAQAKYISDTTEYRKQQEELAKFSECDEDCRKAGTQWSVVYTMQGSLMVLLLVNMIIVAVGAYKAPARLIGGLCGCCLCCIHLIWIIVTAVIRFSKKS